MKTTRELALREARRELHGVEQSADEMLDGGMLYRDAMERFQRAFFRRALVRTQGNVSKTSSLIGVHRNTFTRLVRLSGLRAVNRAKAKKANTSALATYIARRRSA